MGLQVKSVFKKVLSRGLRAADRKDEGRARLRLSESRSQCGYEGRGRLASREEGLSAPKKIMNSTKRKKIAQLLAGQKKVW